MFTVCQILLYLCINSEPNRQDFHSHAICTTISTNKHVIADNKNCHKEKHGKIRRWTLLRRVCVILNWIIRVGVSRGEMFKLKLNVVGEVYTKKGNITCKGSEVEIILGVCEG